jgi:acetolactate synthase regulatory subunit
MPSLWRYRLAVQADPLADGLLRILAAVAIQSMGIVSVRHDQTGARASTVMGIVATEPARVELLAARLAGMPWVRDIQVMARAGADERWRPEREAADLA